MTHLLQTEWLKMHKYKAFWWMAAIIVLSYPGINYLIFQGFQEMTRENTERAMLVKMIIGNPFTFPEVWHTVAYFSSLFVFIPAVIIIMFITNEYTFKTHRQNIIDGWSRGEFLTSKLIDVVIVSLITTALYTLVALIIGLVNKGNTNVNIWSGTQYIGLFALQTFAQLSIAFVIAFLVRKAFIALGIFLCYFMVVENIIVVLGKVKADDAGRFMPIEISDRIIPPPAFWNRVDAEAYKTSLANINLYVVLTILLTAAVWGLCYYINKKRDL
jgi:ABC-type transport system involved in multi-copper enzyme maturation permease subunit